MSLSVYSLVAIAVILGGIGLAWSRKFLALGGMALANLFVFALTAFGPVKACRVGDRVGFDSVIHCDLGLHGDLLASGEPVAFLQLLTSMFVHADLFHLLGNLIILLAFALPFEERIGHRPFVLLYLGSGLFASLAHAVTQWGDPYLAMGASGAVFGIIGAFAGAFPNLVVPLPLPLLVIMMWVRMRVWVAALVFSVQQVVLQTLSNYNPGDNTAYAAHFGGLVAGIVLSQVYVKRKAVVPRVKERVPVERLRPFAREEGARRALEHMEQNRDHPDVFMAWQERFFRSASCPVCQAQVHPGRGAQVVCRNGHEYDLRRGSSEHAALATTAEAGPAQPLGSRDSEEETERGS